MMRRFGLLFAVLVMTAPSVLAQATWTQVGNDIHNPNSGNVGIGTGSTAPAEQLHVFGNAYVQGSYLRYDVADGAAFEIKPRYRFGFGLRLVPNSTAGGDPNRYFEIGKWDNANAYTSLVHINESGDVGIGTTSPTHPLEVAGTNEVATFGGNPAVVTVGSRPNAFMGGYPYGSDATAYFSSNVLNSVGGWQLGGTATSGSAVMLLQGGKFSFFTAPANVFPFDQANGGPRLVITTGGSVGIGIDSPSTSYKLDVSGDTHLNGNVGMGASATTTNRLEVAGNVNIVGNVTASRVIGATYQDVAEWVPASEEMAAGTVVVINPRARNGVMPSNHGYDTSVAGVVSAQPGVVLGVADKSKAMIATTGRVKVRVDASRAPIHAGDLLVTGDRAGVAMKSVPVDLGGIRMHRPGTLIGKALEPLDKGEGEILVLLSLQ
jgi:hypothetical protein